MVTVVGVRSLGEFKLELEFSDGMIGIRDFASHIETSDQFTKFPKDIDSFGRVITENGTLRWPDGSAWDADVLHKEMEADGLLRAARLVSIEEYLQSFSGDRRAEALKQALDIRKFEIDLYWRRGAYFWAFTAAAFAGYLLLQKESDWSNTYVITCLGFLFSLGWWLVNRGSASWQRNWEKHVDLLEDKITGPLYKTHVDRNYSSFWRVADDYPFSPSRINNYLSFL